MKVRVGEGSGLEWDLGGGVELLDAQLKKKISLDLKASLFIFWVRSQATESGVFLRGGGHRATDTPNCASASASTADSVQCRASAGQQAEEPLVIQQMSQAAGMPGI